MIESKEKQNDWIVSTALNTDLGLSDFSKMGLTSENTQLQSKSYYKDKKFIQDNFKTEDGSFDDSTFNKFYDGAALAFQKFNNGTFKTDKDATLFQMEHTYSNLYYGKKSKLKDYDFEVKKVRNPFLEKRGTFGLGSIEESDLSISEIAQKGKVLDFNTGETLDYSANDKGGLGGLFRDPLVLAQYDIDGQHEDFETGRMVEHKAGDYKYNKDGELCYETLGKRDASTKVFLSGFDTITEDGTLSNKFDIFDADDKEQNITKTLARAALKYAPVAIGAVATGGVLPTISAIYLGTTALMNLGESIPGLYKAIEGSVTGSADGVHNKSGLWNVMNSMEAKAKQYRFGSSEYSKKNVFTVENFINLIGDVSIQLGQQTTIAQIPKYLGLDKRFVAGAKTIDEYQKKTKQFNDFSKNLATWYMTVTSGSDAYGRAKEAGHSDRSAGLITLGTLFGLHKVMSSDLGQWSLKGIGLDDVRLAAKPILREESKRLAEAIGNKAIDITSDAGKKRVIDNFTKALFSGLKSFIDDPAKLAPAMLAEALEEISEEMVGDFNMAIGAAASAMNVTRKVNTDFSFGDIAQRYAMAGIGGGIGGGIHRLRTPWSKAHKALGNDNENAKLLNLVWENGADAIEREIEREYEAGILVGDKNLSANKSSVIEGQIAYESATEESDSQAYVIKEGLKNLVRTYEELLTRSGSINKDVDIRKSLMNLQDSDIQALTEFGLEKRVSEHISYYNAQIIDLNADISNLDEKDKDFNSINQRLSEVQLQKQNILDGGHFDHYLQQGLISLNSDIKDLFVNTTIDEFSQVKKGKNYDELSEFDQKMMKLDYAHYKDNTYDLHLEYAVDILNKSIETLAPHAIKYDNNYSKTRIKTYDVLRDAINSASERLDVFDENGEIIDSQKAALLSPDTKNPINIFSTPLAVISEPIPGQDRVSNLQQVVNNIMEMTSMGLPLDGELVGDINSLRKSVITRLNQYSKKNIGNKIDHILPNSSILNYLPVISKLNYTSNDSIIDVDKTIEEFKALDDSEILAQISTNDIISDLINAVEEEKIPYAEYDDLTDEDVVKYVKDLVIESLTDLKANTKTFMGDHVNFLETANNALKSSISNPIYEYLDQISKLTGSNTEGIIKMLKDESTRLESMNLDEYLVNNPEQLKKLQNDINIAQKLIAISQDSPVDNTYGVILNKYRKKYRNLEEIPLINPNIAHLMITDMLLLGDKVDFLLKLSNYNSSDRLREQKKSAMKFYTLFSEIFNPDSEDKSSLLSKISSVHPDLDLLKGTDSINLELLTVAGQLKEELATSKINNETLSKAEKLLTQIETQVHENYKQVVAESDRDTIISKIFNSTFFGFDEFSGNGTSDISSLPSTTLTEFDKAIYLGSIFASNSLEYKTHLTKELERKDENGKDVYNFAPLFSQEYPCRIAYAYAEDTELFNSILGTMVDPKTKKRKAPMLKNLMYIIGYHGTGKTSATANLIHSIFNEKYGADHATVTSIVDRQTKKFKESLKSDTKSYTKAELLSEILGGAAISSFIDSGKQYNDSGYVLSNKLKDLGDNINIKKVIYIDEVTWYDSKELAVLTEWANLNNRVIITLGDNLQQGADVDISYYNVVKSPIIEYSMRAGSTIVKDNSDILRVITKDINSKDNNQESRKEIIRSFNDVWNRDTHIKYHYDSKGLLVGTHIIPDKNSFDLVDSYISKMLSNEVNPENIAVIYESENDPYFDKLKSIADVKKINLVKLSEMQGSEFDYVISTVGVTPPKGENPNDYVKYVKKINTLFSRAKLGNLIIGDLGLNNTKAEFNNVLKFDEEKLQEFRQERLNSLRNTIGDHSITPKIENGKVVKSDVTTHSDSDVTTKVLDDVINNAKGINPDVDEVNEENGKNKKDGKLLGYSSVVSFGGIIEDDKITVPNSYKNLHFDLQMFREMGTDSFGVYSLVNEDGKPNHELLQKLDLLKKEILLNGKNIKDLKNDVDFKGIFGSVNSEYDWNNASFRIVYTTRDKAFDRNNELKYNYVSSDKLMRRLVLHVPSRSNRPDGVLSLSELGTKPNDPIVKAFEDKALSILKSEPFFMTSVDPDAVTMSGIGTRIIPKDESRAYTYDELLKDYAWKNVSDIMIFTGNKERIKQGLDVNTDEELMMRIDELVDDYNLNGRPVVFVTKHPKLKNKTSEELAKIFWNQKVYGIKRALGIDTPHVENLVNMVPLAMDSMTGEQFFNNYGETLNIFKNDKSLALKKIDAISHKFVGLNMMRNMYEYLDYCKNNYYDKATNKYNWKNNEEGKIFNNISGMIKFMEMSFGIASKKVMINNKPEIHIIFTKTVDLDQKVVNPNNVKDLNKVIDYIQAEDRSKADIRTILYDFYYGPASANSSSSEFSFSDITMALYDLTKQQHPKLLEELGDDYTKGNKYHTINSTFARKNLIYVLTKSPVARYPKGIEYHPNFKSKKDESTGGTNWVENCWVDANSKSNFKINGAVIESQRILVDFNKVRTLENAQKIKDDEIKQLTASKLTIKKEVSDMKLSPEITTTLNNIIDNGKSVNDINNDLDTVVKSLSYAELNNDKSENVIYELRFDDTGATVSYVSNLDTVEAVNKPIDQIKVVGEDIEIRFKNEDGTIDIRTLDTSKKLSNPTTNQKASSIVNLETIKVNAYNAKVLDFVNNIEDNNIKALVTAAFDPKAILSFSDFSKLSKLMRENGDAQYRKFVDLTRAKLDIIC